MASTNYPASLDAYPVPNNGDTISVTDHWLGPAVIGIETELGTDPAGSHTNVKDRLDQVDSAMGFKNRIIGGNFSTNPWQRGTSFTGPTSGYQADRFAYTKSTTAVIDIDKTADAPTIAQAGVFTQHCLDVDVTTADATIAAGDYGIIYHRIEGYNLLDLGFGQSGTRYFTLSFWHKHTKTGTHSVAFQNTGNARSYVAEYTQTTTDTWERAEITVPVDTSGTWNYTNDVGLTVRFAMIVGSTYAGTAGSWSANNYFGSSNQVNNFDSTSNHFRIALVQLEAGDKATRFETRSVGQELELCQRYYQVTGPIVSLPLTRFSAGTGLPFTWWSLYQPMRATPAVSYSGTWNAGSGYAGNPSFAEATIKGFRIAGSSSISSNTTVYLQRVSQDETQGITITAEL